MVKSISRESFTSWTTVTMYNIEFFFNYVSALKKGYTIVYININGHQPYSLWYKYTVHILQEMYSIFSKGW